MQVPLHLPPPDELALRQLTFDGVNEALRMSGISLTDQQGEAFVRHFVDALEPMVSTPRHAKLYGNVLLFALPLLKGEVNPVDQMLIEGIRIFYPHVYETIRDNSHYFLGSGGQTNLEPAFKQSVKEAVESALQADRVRDKDTVRTRLLEVLFPRLKAVFANTFYGHEWERHWESEQKVCTAAYFDRYFRYTVPPGDVPDAVVAVFLENASRGHVPKMDEFLASIAEAGGIRRLISKLRRREKMVEPEAARHLAIAIARNAKLLPREPGMSILDKTSNQASILLMRLVSRIESVDERIQVARQIIDAAEPLAFAFECLRWLKTDAKTHDVERVLPAEAEEGLGRQLAARIAARAQEAALYRTFGHDAPGLLWIWNKYGAPGEVASNLTGWLDRGVDEVVAFLLTFVGKAWGVESGLSHQADLERDTYDSITKLIDPAILVAKLKAKYGPLLATPEDDPDDDVPYDLRAAHQFVYLHAKKAQKPEKPSANLGSEETQGQEL